jgi:hypothetical protein
MDRCACFGLTDALQRRHMIRHLNKSLAFFKLDGNSRKTHMLPELSVYERVPAWSIIHPRIVNRGSQGRRIHEYGVDAPPTRRYSEAVTGNIW